MSVSYTNLWKFLIDKKMKRTDLISSAGISANVLARLGKDEYVALGSLEKICIALGCNIGDIVEITNNTEQEDNI